MIRKGILILSVSFLLCGTHTPFYSKRLEAQEGIYHKIEKGQTLWRIAKTYKVLLEDLLRINRIEDVSKVKIGQLIFIPQVNQKLEVNVYNLPKQEEVIDVYTPPEISLTKERSLFIWPVEGKIISKFGPRDGSMHNGIDIKAEISTPIQAARDGIVTYSGNTFQGYGNAIVITHEDDFTTLYAHNSINLVKENQYVKQGEIIGRVGQTGRATTPHLHFEIWKEFVSQDPSIYLP